MPWIEGIGDEVTIGVSVLFGLCILFVAWLSTGIREIPFISVIIVQLTRRATVRNDGANSSNENTESAISPSGNEEDNSIINEATPSTIGPEDNSNQDTVGDSPEVENNDEIRTTSELIIADISSRSEPQTTDSVHVTDVIEQNVNHDASNEESTDEAEPEVVCPVSNDELRERRLNFFSSPSSGKVPSDNQSTVQSVGKCSENDKINSESKSSSEIKPKSLSKLASDFLTAQVPTNCSLNNNSISVNSDSNEQAGSSVDLKEQTDSPSETGTRSEQENSGLEPGEIRVRIKFLNDTQRSVTALATDTIGNFRRRHFSTELSESKLVRFIFNGQDLRNDSSTLQSYNICDNSVLHCLITQPRPEQHEPHHGDDEGLDIGMFMFPLFGLLLGIVWYMRFMYRQLFNVTSTLTLGGITFLYLAAFMSSLRGTRNHEHID